MAAGESWDDRAPKDDARARVGGGGDWDEIPKFVEPIRLPFEQTLPGGEADRSRARDSLDGEVSRLIGRTLCGGRFQILRQIGAGGMGVVYQAHDHQRSEMVALKTLRRLEPALLYRLKREFRALVDVSHPNLVRLHELIAERDTWFFTMEFVEGVDFLTYVTARPNPTDEATPPESESRFDPAGANDGLIQPQMERLRFILPQLAQGLIALHDANKLHRDVKPSNTLVTGAGRVVLLDFGLATELQAGMDQTTHAHLLGTAAYMAPEQAAGSALSPAADWYSLGVMLYEALTGRRPFTGAPMTVMMDKQRKDPPSPQDLMADLPQDLSALCLELLRREPRTRPVGRDVLRRLSRCAGRLPPSAAEDGNAPPCRPFVGRREHLRTLADAFSVMASGRTVVVSVMGQSGEGKTALVQHFVDSLPQRGRVVVLKGRCYQQESLPYRAFDAVVDDLSRYLGGLPRLEAEAILPRDIGPLTQVFPVLRRVEAVADAPRSSSTIPDQCELRKRAFAAFREMLGRLGDRRPLVLCLDDLQWGDRDSAMLLLDLLRPPQAPALLVLACCRTEDASQSVFAEAMRLLRETVGSLLDWREVVVGPLTTPETEELLAELLGSYRWADQNRLQKLARESKGIPFFAFELVEHLRTRAGGQERLPATEEMSLDDVLWRRIHELPRATQRLLEIVAIAGRPLERTIACETAGLGRQAHGALDVLQSARLIRATSRPGCEELDCFHDRIRETILSRLASDTLRDHHRRLALTLKASGRANPEVLAFHFSGAKDHRQAGRCYAEAAELAFGALAFEHAASLYRLAVELVEGEGERNRALRIRLGDALASAGRGREAAQVYLSAAAFGSGGAIELRRRAAMHLLTSGHVDEGVDLLRSVASTAGLRVPKTPFGSLRSFVLGRVRLLLRGTGFHECDVSEVPAERLLRADVAFSASIGLSFVDAIAGVDFQTRAVLLALRTGDPYRIVRVLAGHAAHSAATGRRGRRRAARLVRRLQAFASRLDRPEVLGWISLAEGVIASFEGQWRGVLERCDRAIDIFRNRCTGVAWELDSAQLFSLLALVLLGDLVEFRRRRATLLEEARQRGDLYMLNGLCSSGLIIDRLADDDPEGAERELDEAIGQWTRKGFCIQHHGAILGRTLIDLYRGDGRAAWERVEESQAAYRYSLQRWVQQLRIGMLHTRAWSALAACAGSDDPRPLLRVVDHAASGLERERIPYATAFACLIRAGAAAASGEAEAAMELLEKAAEQFDAVEMRLLAASARRQLGRLAGGERGRELVQQTDAWMRSQTIRNPVRMAAMYTPGFPPSE